MLKYKVFYEIHKSTTKTKWALWWAPRWALRWALSGHCMGTVRLNTCPVLCDAVENCFRAANDVVFQCLDRKMLLAGNLLSSWNCIPDLCVCRHSTPVNKQWQVLNSGDVTVIVYTKKQVYRVPVYVFCIYLCMCIHS